MPWSRHFDELIVMANVSHRPCILKKHVLSSASTSFSLCGHGAQNISTLTAKDTQLMQNISTLQTNDAQFANNISTLTAKDMQLMRNISTLQTKDAQFANNISTLTAKDVQLTAKDLQLMQKMSTLQTKDAQFANNISTLTAKDMQLMRHQPACLCVAMVYTEYLGSDRKGYAAHADVFPFLKYRDFDREGRSVSQCSAACLNARKDACNADYMNQINTFNRVRDAMALVNFACQSPSTQANQAWIPGTSATGPSGQCSWVNNAGSTCLGIMSCYQYSKQPPNKPLLYLSKVYTANQPRITSPTSTPSLCVGSRTTGECGTLRRIKDSGTVPSRRGNSRQLAEDSCGGDRCLKHRWTFN
eukprot:g21380.t1